MTTSALLDPQVESWREAASTQRSQSKDFAAWKLEVAFVLCNTALQELQPSLLLLLLTCCNRILYIHTLSIDIKMRLFLSTTLVLLASSASAFAPTPMCRTTTTQHSTALFETATASETNMADSGKPPASASSDVNIADAEIPTKLPSDVGMDYVPLATMLATGQLAEADQVRLYTELIIELCSSELVLVVATCGV